MPSGRRKTWNKEYIAKTLLSSIFIGAFALFIGGMLIFGPGLDALHLSTLDIVLLGFATYRMGHLISYDRVMEPLRSFFNETIPDPTGEGETVEAKGTGLQQVIGQLLCCPICTGTWAAAGMVYAMYLWPSPARVFVTIMGVVGIGELVNAAGEFLSWGGQLSRNSSGAINRVRKQQEQMLAQQDYRLDQAGSDPIPGYRIDQQILRDRVKNNKS